MILEFTLTNREMAFAKAAHKDGLYGEVEKRIGAPCTVVAVETWPELVEQKHCVRAIYDLIEPRPTA